MMAITGTRGIADVELRSGLRMAFGVALSVLVSLGCTSCSSDEASLECNGNGQDIDAGVGEDGGIGEADAGTGDNYDIDGIPLLVETQSGPVRGLAADSSRVFRAIRYAAPPVGPLRFAAPQPPEPWEQAPEPELNACPQRGVEGLIGAEDCLMLEVWTPLHETATPLPVMVWIHGGGYTAGSGYLTDGMLPTREVVLVSINYRLGPLGFLAHPDLSAEGGGTSGNYGIQDQQLALQWVQDNVSAFGGDPEQVTIFGESAGGSAVGAHIWSSRSTGLFHRAIMQSGTGFRRQPRTLDDAEAQGERLVEALSCDADVSAVECLREVPLETLFNALSVASWRPSFDGVVFERDLFDMMGGLQEHSIRCRNSLLHFQRDRKRLPG